MERQSPLSHNNDAFKSRHRLEQRRRDRAGGDRKTGARITPDQMAEQPGRQHGIANPRRGYEKDVHLAGHGGLYRAVPRLAKQPAEFYL
jgi:hypothetical protein